MAIAVMDSQPKSVMAGLDPATHALPLAHAVPVHREPLVFRGKSRCRRNRVGGRIKPGHDGNFYPDRIAPNRNLP